MTTPSSSALDDGRILLSHLVSACVEAATESCCVIRSVQRLRECAREDSGKDALGAELKDPKDVRSYLTLADVRAQTVIVDRVRQRFPKLAVVGEEEVLPQALQGWNTRECRDQAELATKPKVPAPEELPMCYESLREEEVCLFVDPVDGTREFVEGRLHAVQTLIGIAWNGRAVAGVVGLPFHDRSVGRISKEPRSESESVVLFGIDSLGVFGIPEHGENKEEDRIPFFRTFPENELVCATSTSQRDPIVVKTKEMISAKYVMVGGCGNKVLRLLTGQADVTLMNMGSSLWDTCATEALLRAAGGDLTTLLGFPVDYSSSIETSNRFGIVATSRSFTKVYGKSHAQLCQAIREELPADIEKLHHFAGLRAKENKLQAFDIVRDISGNPLTASHLSKVIFGKDGCVESYEAPEIEAVRYKQSVCCRIKLELTPEAGVGNVVKSAFYKRAVLREMPYAMEKFRKSPFKTARDVRANQNEVIVLQSALLREFVQQSRVQVALPYEAKQLVREQNPIDSRFVLLLRDLETSEWAQFPHFSNDQLRMMLGALAEFHSFFWLGLKPDGVKAEFVQNIWPHGGYCHLLHQPKGQIDDIVPVWERLSSLFPFADKQLGERIRRIALVASEVANGVTVDQKTGEALKLEKWEESKYRTVVHGDLKAANLFFKRSDAQIGMIDFQWTGIGLGAVDVVYFLAASATAGIQTGEVNELVREYHARLLQGLCKYGVSKNADQFFPYCTFRRQFAFAFVDLARVVIADHWKTIDKSVLDKRKGALSFNAYNKDFEVAEWFVKQTEELLAEIEQDSNVACL